MGGPLTVRCGELVFPVAWLGLILAGGLLASGCATLPDAPAERALYQDVRQVVVTQQRTSWVVDRLEYEDIAAEVLTSYCQTTPSAREGLRRWVAGQASQLGAPAAIFAETGEIDDDALIMARVAGALDYARSHAESDCPFWLPPVEDFAGVQTDGERLLLFVESNPNAALLVEGDRTSLSGGGSGRFLVGYGFSDSFTVASGVEMGGRGLISADSRQQDVGAIFTQAIPTVFRFRDLSQIYDVEVAATSFTRLGSGHFHPGVRVALGTGFAAVRVRGFLPLAMVQTGYEFYPATGGQPTTHLFRVGTALSLDYDP